MIRDAWLDWASQLFWKVCISLTAVGVFTHHYESWCLTESQRCLLKNQDLPHEWMLARFSHHLKQVRKSSWSFSLLETEKVMLCLEDKESSRKYLPGTLKRKKGWSCTPLIGSHWLGSFKRVANSNINEGWVHLSQPLLEAVAPWALSLLIRHINLTAERTHENLQTVWKTKRESSFFFKFNFSKNNKKTKTIQNTETLNVGNMTKS